MKASRRQLIPEAKVGLMARAMAQALWSLHRKYIVHRNLKMEMFGVEVSSGSHAKLLISNFDLAFCLAPGQAIRQNFLTFTVSRVSAPEVEANRPHDISLDIWTLGQIIYQLLTG